MFLFVTKCLCNLSLTNRKWGYQKRFCKGYEETGENQARKKRNKQKAKWEICRYVRKLVTGGVQSVPTV